MAPRSHTACLEPGDEVAGAVGGRQSLGDSTGWGGGPGETGHSTGAGDLHLLPCSCPPGPGLYPLDLSCPSSLDLGHFVLPGAQTEVGNLGSMAAQPFLKLWEEGEGQRRGLAKVTAPISPTPH